MARITAWILSVVLTIGSAVMLLFPFSNPVSEFVVTQKAEAYISENFEDTDYYIDSVNYDFKTGSYYVLVESPGSKDKGFTIYAGRNGDVSYDTYESAVVNKWNTAGRINDEYRLKVENALFSEDFPYNHNIAFGDIEFCESDRPTDGSVPDYAISTSTLELDGVYDIGEIGKKAGHITIYINVKEVTAEKLAEVLLGIRAYTDKANVSFYAVTCVLEPENDESFSGERIEVMNFLYSDIYQEGLTERVKQAAEKTEEYYKEQDALK